MIATSTFAHASSASVKHSTDSTRSNAASLSSIFTPSSACAANETSNNRSAIFVERPVAAPAHTIGARA